MRGVLAHPSTSSSFRSRSAWLLAPAFARAAIALLAILLTVGAQWGSTPTVSLFANEWVRDRFLRQATSVAREPRVLVVDIDEASLARIGPWPWPQERMADLVEILLANYSARGVALDIVLPKPAAGAGESRLALLARHGPLVLAQPEQ